MEGMREIATAYYGRATGMEKDLVEELFGKLDGDGDGKISFTEFKNSAWSGQLAAYEDVFLQLDANGDGILDFFEFLTLYYIVKKVSLSTCKGCSFLLVGPYFSCLQCLGKGSATYDLCCCCYREGNSDQHKHSSEFIKDHHTLLQQLRNRSTDQAKTSNSDIEELRDIARSYYKAGSTEVQTLAYEFFKSMDTDGDDKVNLEEFLTFMIQEGHAQMRNLHFFRELDQNNYGTLDFWEVMTLYYIIKSGRPFCDGCGEFIPGMYLSCVDCFNVVGSSFTLCRDCYRSTSSRCRHTHNGRAQFLDNYTLLKATKDPALAAVTGVNQNELRSSPSSNATIPVPQSNMYINTGPTYNTSYTTVYHPNNNSNAIVPASNVHKWSPTLHAFETALGIGVIAGEVALAVGAITGVTMCTIL